MNIAEIRQMVLAVAPGVPATIVDMHIRGAARDFFARSQRWRWTTEPIILVQDLNFYGIDLPPFTTLSRILRVNCSEGTLQPEEEMDLRAEIDRGAKDGMRKYAVTAEDELIIGPSVPKGGINVYVDATLIPSGGIVNYPDNVILPYVSAIVNGALAEIYLMPQGWNNPQMADRYKSLFEQGLNVARNERERLAVNVHKTVSYGGL